ncbi:MAG TPA: DUF4349 domain-containing protein, partial [Pyrinomonadaceae bacterium]|nr:DUF4349 domain-containing protein [Pyrinomonadaceae bacterium]
MKLITLLVLLFSISVLSGCGGAMDERSASYSSKVAEQKKAAGLANQTDTKSAPQVNVSLDQASSVNAASQAIERKIIRNANLIVEVAAPTDVQRKIFSVAESHGGFVVTSEMTQQTSGDQSKPAMAINLVVRVPASQFDQVVEAIRSVGIRVIDEKRTGQDVTEEFIDLE